MELTREEAIRNFREHWASNAITGVDKGHKGDYLERNGYHNILYNCFLCEFTRLGTSDKNCSKCPIEWPLTKFRGITPCGNSYYGDWNSATTYEERKRLAAIIRDLPEKNEAKPALKIGDWVEVLNTGGCHTTYDTFFTENNLDQFAGKFRSGGNPVIGVAHKIVAIGKYEGKSNDCYGPLYVIEASNGQVYIMNNSHKELELTDPPKIEPKFKEGDKVVPVSKSKGDSFETWSKYRKKDFVTVQQLPPNRHGDVYVCNGDFFLESDLRPYVEPPKFKFAVGDKVRAIAETNGWGEVKKGDTGTITHTPDTHPCKDKYEHYKDRYRVDFPAQKEWDGKEECFELVTDEPKAEAKTTFSVGDRVRNIKEYDYHPEAVGKIGTVIQVTDSDYTAVEFDEYVDGHNGLGNGKEGYCWCFEPEYLELVKDESKQEPKSFEIGDRVRIKANGRVGTVKGIINSHPSIGVEFSEPIPFPFGHDFNGHLPKGKKGHCYFCYEEEIELLPINHCPENKTVEDTCVGKIDRFPRKFIFSGNKTTCIIALDGKQYKGTAKCAPSDKWDETLGAELAYARAGIALWKDHERQLLGRG